MPRFLSPVVAFAVVLLGLAAFGCSHLDTSAPGSADRVVTGEITAGGEEALPSPSEVWVRVLDLAHGEARPEVLGEQTIANPGHLPVSYRVEFRAEDAQLRQNICIDVRVSVGRQVRYYTVSRQPLTPGNIAEPVTVRVVPAQP